MIHKFHLRVISVFLILAILIQPVSLALVPAAQATALNALVNAPQGASSIYLPLVTQPPGPPAFEINSPGNGWTISGSLWFAVQVTDAKTVTSMTFQAGSTILGTDATPADGFKIFLDASTLPAGSQQLSATGSGPSGVITKSVTVNVVPLPPSSGTLGMQGGVLASEIGSILTFPPGALPDGSFVSVTEKSQEDITAETGIDWDAMGVTFLGAQEIQTTAPISLPLGVSSAGFGNRVQPGQAVVNYRIIPDADGDGVDELVVVNTASVMPNNDVISDPVPQVTVGSVEVTSNLGTTFFLTPDGGLSGPPGTWLQFEVSGFNPLSADGNVGIWTSVADGSVFEISGDVSVDPSDPNLQIFETVIPPLPSGTFSLILRNDSTSYATDPFIITIQPAVLPTRPAVEVIDDFFSQSIGFVNSNITLFPEDLADQLSDSVVNLQLLQADLDELAVAPSPDEQDVLNYLAVLIENSEYLEENNFLGAKNGDTLYDCIPQDVLNEIKEMGEAFKHAGSALSPFKYFLPPPLSVLVFETSLAFTGAGYLYSNILPYLAKNFDLVCPPEIPPLPCVPSQNGSGSITGMGSAPPPGGNGCGNVFGDGSSSLFGNLSQPDQAPGDIVIKIFSNSLRGPFSGIADPGGYFFIPLIPEGAPYVALAIDTANGETRSFEGIGPATGESTYMFFDFYTNITTTVPIQINEVVSGTISAAGELDFYSFTAKAGQLVYFDLQAGFNAEWNWQLLDANGNVIFNQDFQDDPGSYTLTAGGTYTMIIGDQISTFTGSYQFQLLGFLENPLPVEPQ